MKPYLGKILLVDLGKQEIEEQIIPEHVYKRFLSGLGLGIYLLYELIPAETNPLGPENVLGFVSGLLTGAGSMFSGRWMAVGKSPLTGTWGEANCGGDLSLAIKQCGYDGIFFIGISEKPVYLQVINGKASLADASDLWGKDVAETEGVLHERHGGNRVPSVACIGPAGEKMSLISGICHDGGRIAARSGLGAVMGSKRLKALVLSGRERIGCSERKQMRELSARSARFVKTDLPMPKGRGLSFLGKLLRWLPVSLRMDGLIVLLIYKKWGTIGLTRLSVEWGDAPIKNWLGSERDFPSSVSVGIEPDKVLAQEKKKYHCYMCPLGCGGKLDIEKKEIHKPEYESVMAFGGLILNNDMEAIYQINEMLNRAGMDTISAGGTVAMAIECFEKGIINTTDTGGLELGWGQVEAVKALVQMMIEREGFGDVLADGSKIAAKKIGGGAENCAVHANGQEIAMHDPRLDPGYGLHAVVEPSPGRHTAGSWNFYNMYQLWRRVKGLPKFALLSLKSRAYAAGRSEARMAVANSCYTQLYNGAGICLFGALMGSTRVPVFDYLNAATGWRKTPQEYMEIGRRIQTLKQLFNIRQGVLPVDIEMPKRALGYPALEHGANKGRTVNIEALRRAYWREIGWHEATGVPEPKTMSVLGLKKAIGSVEEEGEKVSGMVASSYQSGC